jgi:Serine/threonine protein kinase
MTSGDNEEVNEARELGAGKPLIPDKPSPEDARIPADILATLGDRYSDYEFIGSGTTSTVFRARDNTLAKLVAIKILKHNSPADLIRFQREARIASKLGHPNLINILKFDVTNENNAFIVMDVIQGDDLKTIIKQRKQLAPARALAVAYYIAKGMAHAHSKNLAHRDLKSSNVMVEDIDSPDVKVIVVDFGLAKEQEQGKTGTASVIGSPLYMSPEQALGQPADQRADIYSLACIMYEMISGSTPFQDDDLFKILQKHAYEPAPRLSSLAPNTTLPEGLDELLLKMMEKDKESRIQTMEAVKQTILAIEQGKTATTLKPAQRVSLKTIVSAILLAGIVFGAVNFRLDAQRKARIKPKLSASEKLRVLKVARQETDIANVDKYFEKDRGDHREQDGVIVRCVNLDATTDDTLRFLPTTGLDLTQLSLEGAHITGEGLRYLRKSGIKSLNLVGVKLSPNGWKQVNSLKSLDELLFMQPKTDDEDPTQSNITNDDLKYLANNKYIRRLNLTGCKLITDACVDTLLSMKELNSVYLARTMVTDKLLKKLASKGSLRDLDLEETGVTDEGVEVLCQNNKNLDKLAISKCSGISSKAVEAIAANEPRIGRLNIGFNKKIKPESIMLLSACPKLHDLEMHEIPIGAKELEVLLKHKFVRLYLADVTFGDSSLNMFRNQDKMEVLWITGPKITEESGKKLKAMLPADCNVLPFRGIIEDSGFGSVYKSDP